MFILYTVVDKQILWQRHLQVLRTELKIFGAE